VSGPVDLDVRTGSGRILVRNGDASTVQINATIRAGGDWSRWFRGESAAERIKAIESKPPIEQNGNMIRIGYPSDDELYRNVSISYEIVTPAATRLKSHTGSGSQSIEGLRGPVEAHSGSGDLKIMDVDEGVSAHTGSGSIELDGIVGNVEGHAGSGSIRANNVGTVMPASSRTGATGRTANKATAKMGAAQLELETGSGTIRLMNVAGSLRAQTGSGGIEVTGEPEGNWELRTGSGGVRVNLPQNAAFDLYARTGSGSITVDHPLTVEGTISKREVRGKVRGGGGVNLEIRTGSGGIRVQ
jgi:hypothetical protein